MSNEKLIIEERARDIGGFLVGRLIPFRRKRMVGPFIFIDHMGPSPIGPGRYMDIGQHPHIGLSTLTFLFEGAMLHKDSLGVVQEIVPGSVNWMTAGSGVVHTELTPERLKDGQEHTIHGFQIWVALPKDKEDIEPSFFHIDGSELPRWQVDGVRYKLVAGEAFGHRSPVPVYSPLFMLEVETDHATIVNTGNALQGEIGICVVRGSVTIDGDVIESGNMLVSRTKDHCSFAVSEDAHLLLFGGQPFEEERHIYWNFVSTEKAKIEAAKEAWKNKTFKMVDGETSYVPLP